MAKTYKEAAAAERRERNGSRSVSQVARLPCQDRRHAGMQEYPLPASF
ncbi:MAG TPA: hypothetical protein VGQ39_19470 [Pyrinomonadaceae bacterium]|nr:hypothetical protein [Pyrinomonadaceae bacterium]